ncbi:MULTISPECIES: N-acetylmuramoyl-L-alanine amidase [unclassified Myroides]|uniref:N-acetylmuramoyl-L-alanine amidase n=1 Tax=unclassified Myroides TaxID=2642485 RepID=UPI003D2F772B
MREVSLIVVHCTGAPQNQTVDSIKAFWRNVLGWKSPGYHKLIEPNGNVITLASPDQITNGVKGFNSKAYHISYIGGQNGIDNRTVQQKCALEHEVREAKKLFPNAKIVGHRDLSPDLNGDGIITPNEWTKECPSFEVKDWLKEINL